MASPVGQPANVFGGYRLYAPIAEGGMATIYLARSLDRIDAPLVAIKRLHAAMSETGEFVAMLLDEARIASRIRHPNVISVLDVVEENGEVALVEEYVHGVSFDALLEAEWSRGGTIPTQIAVAVAAGALRGLHAAHEARDERGRPLDIVHRDVSPQNLLVGIDGATRLLDFGIAKATCNAHETRRGVVKGKISYIAPEQARGARTGRVTDIYALGVVLWEALVGRSLRDLRDPQLIPVALSGMSTRLTDAVGPKTAGTQPRRWRELLALEPVLARAMAIAPEDRYQTAAEMLEALCVAVRPAPATEVAHFVSTLTGSRLAECARLASSAGPAASPFVTASGLRRTGPRLPGDNLAVTLVAPRQLAWSHTPPKSAVVAVSRSRRLPLLAALAFFCLLVVAGTAATVVRGLDAVAGGARVDDWIAQTSRVRAHRSAEGTSLGRSHPGWSLALIHGSPRPKMGPLSEVAHGTRRARASHP